MTGSEKAGSEKAGTERVQARRPRHLPARAKKSTRGFTLLEVLVALVIFGILTVALSNAMSAALHARALAEQRQADNETIRGVFATLARDLQSAYCSMYDPNSLFVAGSGSGGTSSNYSNSLLTLGTITQRVITTDTNIDPTVDPSQTGGGLGGSVSASQSGSTDPPQQPVALVRYDLDAQSGTLMRYAQAIPNVQTLQQATPGPDNVVASNIVSMQLQFWDPNKQSWRTDWDFEQPNLPPAATAAQTMNFPAATTTSSSSSSTSSASSSTSSTSTGTGDVGLPLAVQVTLVVRKSDGSQGTYTTILPIVAPQVQDFPYLGGQNYDPNATPNSQTNLNSTTTSTSGGSSSGPPSGLSSIGLH